MRLRGIASVAGAAAAVLIAAAVFAATPEDATFSERDLRSIVALGPWPVDWRSDPSNRASGRPAAIAFGEALFLEPRLSGTGAVSCASCHRPERSFTDGQRRAAGIAGVDRNTPSLANVRLQRWFGWDGAADNLWAQSLRPMLEAREMGGSVKHVATLIRDDAALGARYREAFGTAPPADDEALAVDVAKALAAYQETLVTGRTPFDDFRDALARGDTVAAARYPLAARRGLALFIGKGGCNVCHIGPNFTNGEFHDTGVPFFVAPGRVDTGRYDGIRRVQASRYNLLGAFSDDARRTTATPVRHVALDHRNFGEFRTPTLRNVARTAPYMHDGSLATLRDVVRHYSELDVERLHADGERILQPLHLKAREIDDLVAFLESLSEPPPITGTGRN